MPGKLIPCALCQEEAAAFYCVNDDAHLCATCDASTHAANALLARHERRPISAVTAQAESAANAAPAPSTSTDADVAVVPQLGGADSEALTPGPLTLYEDSFFARSLSASDLLDLDSDDLELPGLGASATPFSFDPMADCVVPSFADDMPRTASYPYFQPPAFSAQQTSFLRQEPAYSPIMRQPQTAMVPTAAPKPLVAPKQRTPEEEAEEAARVARHRERQRKKRNFGRAVRYQSRRAYAEIRPRIKGRFVTPEEYAAYQAQVAAEKAGVAYVPAAAVAPAAPLEEDAVVPTPTFVA